MIHRLKQLVKRVYKTSTPYLPRFVRTEVEGYASYRSDRLTMADAQSKLPYWERREKQGIRRDLVRIGFVGAGTYAQHHLRVLSHLDQVRISALLTRGSPRGRAAAEAYGIERVFADPDQFFAFDEVDAYVVVVPVDFLKKVALEALQTGKPVLMEKPPGVRSADTAELAACAERHRTFGMVGMNRRFYSVVEHGLAALADCGPIRGLTAEIPQGITRHRHSRRLSEFVYDHFYVANSVHGIDLVRYILGDPLDVHSLAHPNNKQKNAGASFAAILEYPSGVVGTVTDLWDTPESWRVKVIAEMGWLELQDLDQGWLVYPDGRRVKVKSDPVDADFRTGLYAQDLHFIESVRSGKRPLLPACLLPDAIKTMVLMEQITGDTLRTRASSASMQAGR